MSEQCLIDTQEEFEITTIGRSKADALNLAFKKLRLDAYKKVGYPISYMNTKEVHVDILEEKKFTEKFMFFFMPREKTDYKVKFKFVVEIKYVKF